MQDSLNNNNNNNNNILAERQVFMPMLLRAFSDTVLDQVRFYMIMKILNNNLVVGIVNSFKHQRVKLSAQ